MNKKQLYESIMQSIAKEVKTALNEAECNLVLEEYGLSYIFALNEDESQNIFLKFKLPFVKSLEKIKSKFGKLSSNALADIVKKAEKKGKKTLYSVLTLITLFTGTLPAKANVTNDFINNFTSDAAKASFAMSQARGFDNDLALSQFKNYDIDAFYDLFQTLDSDTDNLYATSGVGCSENKDEAARLAKEDALATLKNKYGNNAVEEYDVQFKLVDVASFIQTGHANGQNLNKTFYTAIVVAYQAR